MFTDIRILKGNMLKYIKWQIQILCYMSYVIVMPFYIISIVYFIQATFFNIKEKLEPIYLMYANLHIFTIKNYTLTISRYSINRWHERKCCIQIFCIQYQYKIIANLICYIVFTKPLQYDLHISSHHGVRLPLHLLVYMCQIPNTFK